MTQKQWQVETEQYVPRILKALELHEVTLEKYGGFPDVPLSEPPDEKARAILQLALFVLSGIKVVQLILDSLIHRWSIGMLISAPLEIRLIMEYRAAISFGLEIAAQLEDKEKYEKAFERCIRLTTGSKTPILLPWGEMSAVKSFSTMEFVRHLEELDSGVLADYEYLCESSHPNAMQHMYLVMASKTYDNWGNEQFKKHAHEMLDRCVEICMRSVVGLAKSAQDMTEICAKHFPSK
ncbi:MAG TPA: hypothetical protein VM639_00660 [Dongiaceae bacterium]|nr:hypothetical protein [Dongiaceae bacterium]